MKKVYVVIEDRYDQDGGGMREIHKVYGTESKALKAARGIALSRAAEEEDYTLKMFSSVKTTGWDITNKIAQYVVTMIELDFEG